MERGNQGKERSSDSMTNAMCLVIIVILELLIKYRVSWTARRSNQSILRAVNPEYSLVGLKLKLKLQYFGHLLQRANS